jgi:hypothetical protein
MTLYLPPGIIMSAYRFVGGMLYGPAPILFIF